MFDPLEDLTCRPAGYFDRFRLLSMIVALIPIKVLALQNLPSNFAEITHLNVSVG